MSRKKISIAVVIPVMLAVAVAVAAVALALWYLSQLHRPGLNATDGAIVIPKGASPSRISAIITDSGIPHSPLVYRLEDVRRGDDYRPKAGEFALPARASLADAFRIIHKGESIQHPFTIPEGATVPEVMAALKGQKCFTGNISAVPDEGDLLPETYFYICDTDRDVFITRIVSARETAFSTLWDARQSGLPLKSLDEAVVLASIIEKETGIASERPLVASVFINRLRRGMRLQSDPTVLYGLAQAGRTPEKLLRSDINHPTPWNTYAISGLPPSPICNPGLESLRAALNPATSPYYYFVADGRGGHAFAATLEEHNRNVARWRAIQNNGE